MRAKTIENAQEPVKIYESEIWGKTLMGVLLPKGIDPQTQCSIREYTDALGRITYKVVCYEE